MRLHSDALADGGSAQPAWETLKASVEELQSRSGALEERLSRIEHCPLDVAFREPRESKTATRADDSIRSCAEGRLAVAQAALEEQLRSHGALVQERLGGVQLMLNSFASKQASVQAVITSLTDQLEGERDRRESYMSGLHERINKLERKLEQDFLQEQETRELGFDAVRQDLRREQEARELGHDELSRQLAAPERLRREVSPRLLACDGEDSDTTAAQLRALLAAERTAREAQYCGVEKYLTEKLSTIQDLVAVLEKEQHDSADRRYAELSQERAQREALAKDIQDKLSAQQAQLGAERAISLAWDKLEERVVKLEEYKDSQGGGVVGEKMQMQQLARDLRSQVVRLETDLRGEESTRRADASELKDMMRGERLARELQQSSVKEMLAEERGALEVHLSSLHEVLAQNRQQRPPHAGLSAKALEHKAERPLGHHITGMVTTLHKCLNDLERSVDPLVGRGRGATDESSGITESPQSKHSPSQRTMEIDYASGDLHGRPEVFSQRSVREATPLVATRTISVMPPPSALLHVPEAGCSLTFAMSPARQRSRPASPALPSTVPCTPRTQPPAVTSVPFTGSSSQKRMVLARPATVSAPVATPVVSSCTSLHSSPLLLSPGGPLTPPPARLVTRQVSSYHGSRANSARAPVSVRAASAGR